MIKKSELLMGRDKTHASEYNRDISKNLDVLCEKMNIIRAAYGKPMQVASGWRPPSVNDATSNAGKKSKHTVGLAVDIRTTNDDLWNWCLANLQLMQDLGIYLEHRNYTPSWVHFSLGPPGSLKRIFIPSTKPAPAPTLFDGKYDSKFDGIEKD
jgi:uncharacterized protein YcbK (DUF882 family)